MEVEKGIFKLTGVVERLGLHQDGLSVGFLHLQDTLCTPQSLPPLALRCQTLAPGYEDVRALLAHAQGDLQMLQCGQVLLLVEKILRLSKGDINNSKDRLDIVIVETLLEVNNLVRSRHSELY